MTIQRKTITQNNRRTFPKVFSFGMGRQEHFGSGVRDIVHGRSEEGRRETLVASGKMDAPAGRKPEGMKE